MMSLRLEERARCTPPKASAWLLSLTLVALLGCTHSDDDALTEAGSEDKAEMGARDAAAEAQGDPRAIDAARGEGDAAHPDANTAANTPRLDAALSASDAAVREASVPAPHDASATAMDAAAQHRRCKRGVGYNREQAADAKLFGSSLTWWYDWGTNPEASALVALEAAGVEFVPMIWSGPPRRDIDVEALIRTIPRSAAYLLGFNEPNFGAQANLTPEQAAAAWPKLEEIARARNLELVSPAPNYCGGNCNQTDPFAWLDAFFAACRGCKVDYVAFHWYACSIEALKSIVGKYESKYGKPVWITELACLDDPGDHSAAGQRAYMDKAVAFLESDPQVFRYAWFIGRSSQPAANDLFAPAAALTPLGSAYVAYPGTCTE
jgi:Glycosyl hydrolase catalytic core